MTFGKNKDEEDLRAVLPAAFVLRLNIHRMERRTPTMENREISESRVGNFMEPRDPPKTTEEKAVPPTASQPSSELRVVKALCCVICLFVLVFLLAQLLRPPSSQAKKACTSHTCLEAVAYMDSIVDHSIDPCEDFYGHVCHRWLNAEPPSSFIKELVSSFSSRRYELLENPPEKSDRVVAFASQFYASCLEFLRGHRNLYNDLQMLFQALGINVKSWLSISDPKYFFKEIMRLSLKHRFHTLLKSTVKSRNGSTHYAFTAGGSYSSLMEINNISLKREYLRSAVQLAGTTRVSDAVINKVLDIEERVNEDTTLIIGMRYEVPVSSVNCPGLSPDLWVDSVNSVMPSADHINNDTRVNIGSHSRMCAMLENVLFYNSSEAKTFYLLSLITAHVMKYYLPGSTYLHVPSNCYKMTMKAFKSIWVPLLSRIFGVSSDTEKVVDVLFNATSETVRRRFGDIPWLYSKEVIAGKEKVRSLNIVRFRNEISNRTLACSHYRVGKILTRTNFMVNFVRVYERDGASCELTVKERSASKYTIYLLKRSLAYFTLDNILVVPVSFAIPPFLYSGTSDLHVDYATMGVVMLRAMIAAAGDSAVRRSIVTNNTSLDPHEASLKNEVVQQCYRNHLRTWNVSLTEEKWKAVLATIYALKFAHHDPILGTNNLRNKDIYQLFFKRFCLTLCTNEASDQFIVLDKEAARSACVLAVSSTQQFHDAFGCKLNSGMRPYNHDCSEIVEAIT